MIILKCCLWKCCLSFMYHTEILLYMNQYFSLLFSGIWSDIHDWPTRVLTASEVLPFGLSYVFPSSKILCGSLTRLSFSSLHDFLKKFYCLEVFIHLLCHSGISSCHFILKSSIAPQMELCIFPYHPTSTCKIILSHFISLLFYCLPYFKNIEVFKNTSNLHFILSIQ